MSYPLKDLPENAPRHGNAVTRFIGRRLLGIIGYKIEGKFPNEPKMIVICSPHTSNWDLILALGTIMSLGIRLNFIMKKEAFIFPLKGLFMALGGIPLDRSSPKAIVKQTLKSFENNEKFWLVLSPEGTRKPVKTWKAGFARIARAADVPIFVMGVDSRTKTLHLDHLVQPAKKKPADCAIEQVEKLRLYSKERFTGLNPKND